MTTKDIGTKTKDYRVNYVEVVAKDIFLTQLNYIYYGLEGGTVVSKDYAQKKAGGKPLSVMLNIPLIKKMIAKHKKVKVAQHCSYAQLMWSLVDNLGLDYLDSENMKNIISNYEDIYNTYYRKAYENTQKEIFINGYVKPTIMEDYEI